MSNPPTMTEIRSFCDRYIPGWSEVHGSKGPEAAARCPFCQSGNRHGRVAERTFRVNLTDGRYICNRQDSCGQRGGWLTLVERLSGGRPIAEPRELVSVQTARKAYRLPPEEAAASTASNHLAYLERRGISVATAQAWKVGYRDGCILWPVYDDAGTLIDVKRRTLSGKGFFHEVDARPGLVGMHLIPDGSDSLLIVEGEIDAMSATEYGIRSVVSMPGGTGDLRWVEEWLPWLDRFSEILIGLDDDEAGRRCAVELAKRIGHWRTAVVKWPMKDLNECLVAGVPGADIIGAVNNATVTTPEALVSMLDCEDEIVAAFLDDGRLVGTSSGLRGLDGILRGFRPGELTVWTGANGSGKSTVLGQVASNIIVHADERVCIASLELPVPRYSRWLVMQTAGNHQLDETMVRETVRQLGGSLWFIDHVGTLEVDRLLDVWTYARRRYDCRHFIVDSMMRLRIGVDDYTAQKTTVDRLAAFARTYDAHVHLVAHPRKGASDHQGVDKAAIKGTSEITDLAHNVIVVTRHEAHSTIEVLKHREHGTLGKVAVTVNPDSKLVLETTIQEEVKNVSRVQKALEDARKGKQPVQPGGAGSSVPTGRDAAAGRDEDGDEEPKTYVREIDL